MCERRQRCLRLAKGVRRLNLEVRRKASVLERSETPQSASLVVRKPERGVKPDFSTCEMSERSKPPRHT